MSTLTLRPDVFQNSLMTIRHYVILFLRLWCLRLSDRPLYLLTRW